jgi:Protein of unknown function (DUF3223)
MEDSASPIRARFREKLFRWMITIQEAEMGKARQIILDTRTFDKAGDADAFFSAMLRRYSVGVRVSDIDANELRALLKRHDEKEEKIGVGVAYFKVGFSPDDHPGNCFWIVRTDGSKFSFSFPHCIAAKPYD